MHLAHNHDNPAHYGIRTKEFKLTYYYGLPLDAKGAVNRPTPPGWEMYDLRSDPGELHNIYEKTEYRHIREELKKQLYELKKQYGDGDEQYPELKEQFLPAQDREGDRECQRS